MTCAPWFREPPFWLWSWQDDGRMTQLHQEIQDFYERVRPKQNDENLRERALERVKLVITALWPSCDVKVFGSFATGLYLPKVSDIDILILGDGLGNNGHFRTLSAAFRSSGITKYVEFVGRAKVPILKFREEQSGIHFDIRFNLNQELRAAELISSIHASYPCFAPLYLVLKAYLQAKYLNEVYHTGGINSYTLFVMLYFLLQVHPDGAQALTNSGLGFLLAGFLQFYGESLNVQDYGISCSGAQFFLKLQKNFKDPWKPYLLAVEDPLLPTNDIGKSSFNFPKIQAIFKKTFDFLVLGHFQKGSTHMLMQVLPFQSTAF
ncbi:hypothetical protein KP509_30G048000 [Ceratopteris richardii]|uniref:polynucleotide adenylyltransferase n=1 Tax=Ceratopteris richardii TaxID=49495 RepID=A0A8T2R218_CERRI|nr:hypothetical protein KP509_30G048000 [Ceratopteris richardii]KAH7290422.1 hypothetical protein KP509_30G048000 [Ceratopteris richardii]